MCKRLNLKILSYEVKREKVKWIDFDPVMKFDKWPVYRVKRESYG